MGTRNLPVLATALQGWRLLAGDWWVLLRIILLPLAILVALDLYLDALWWGYIDRLSAATPEYADRAIANLITLDEVLALILGGLTMALWQRVRVAGRRALTPLGLLAAAPNIAALTVLWCSLMLIAVGVIWVFDSVIWGLAKDPLDSLLLVRFQLADNPVLYSILHDLVLQGVPLIVTLHVVGRLGLMLWARPGGGEGALDRAWAAGGGNGWRLAAAIFLALLPVTVAMSVLESGLIDTGMLYTLLSFDLSYLLQLIVAVAVIATAHDTLLGDVGAAAAANTADGVTAGS